MWWSDHGHDDLDRKNSWLFVTSDLRVFVAGRPSSGRHLTTIDALRRFSGYFHLQNIVLRGEFVENGRRVVLRGGDNEMQVMLNDVNTIDGPVEVRGQLIDIGRLAATDPRLGRYENSPIPITGQCRARSCCSA